MGKMDCFKQKFDKKIDEKNDRNSTFIIALLGLFLLNIFCKC